MATKTDTDENFIEMSKKGWLGPSIVENINAGSLQRIATATELLAKKYQDLEEEAATWERLYRAKEAECLKLYYSLRGMRGAFNRLKKKHEG